MTITLKEVKDALPTKLKSAATQELTDLINNVTTDPIIADRVKQNFVSYTSVMEQGRFSAAEYLNAVTYVTYKHMGLSNKDAYIKTFPDRYNSLVARGMPPSSIAAYIYAHSRSKLVTLLLEQTLVPIWIVNQDLYQKAINVQAKLMLTAHSEKVRSDAANSLLTHLAKPKDSVASINIDMRENTGIQELKNTLQQLAQQQIKLLQSGVKTKDVAESKLVHDVEAIEVS